MFFNNVIGVLFKKDNGYLYLLGRLLVNLRGVNDFWFIILGNKILILIICYLWFYNNYMVNVDFFFYCIYDYFWYIYLCCNWL